MEQITYKPTSKGESVYLAGKQVGTIKAIEGGWAYFPKATKTAHGEVFQRISQVKQSIECEVA
jgi:hypothetical protein